MKTIIPIVIAILSIQMAVGFEPICHVATIDDYSWSEAKCLCSGNGQWYAGKSNFVENCKNEHGAPEKVTKCECRIHELISSRFGGGNNVLTWEPEEPEADGGLGYPNLGQ